MSGVDYSKWDKMVEDMSDSDDDAGNSNVPQVTQFDTPQSVTFGGTEASEVAQGRDAGSPTPPPPPPSASMGGSVAEAGAAGSKSAGGAAKVGGNTGTAPSKVLKPISDEQLVENGRAVVSLEANGRLQHVWRQTRTEVTVVVPAPPGTRAGDVKVSLSAKPGTITEGVADLIKVCVRAKGEGGQEVLLEGELAFQAKLDGEGDVDWELKDYPGTIVARDKPDGTASSVVAGEEGKFGVNGAAGVAAGAAAEAPTAPAEAGDLARKVADNISSSSTAPSHHRDRRGIEVILKKHCPVPNAAVWWKSLLKGGPEIDVARIQGRAANGHQSVWEEALGMFKDKMAARKGVEKVSVDMGEGD